MKVNFKALLGAVAGITMLMSTFVFTGCDQDSDIEDEWNEQEILSLSRKTRSGSGEDNPDRIYAKAGTYRADYTQWSHWTVNGTVTWGAFDPEFVIVDDFTEDLTFISYDSRYSNAEVISKSINSSYVGSSSLQLDLGLSYTQYFRVVRNASGQNDTIQGEESKNATYSITINY